MPPTVFRFSFGCWVSLYLFIKPCCWYAQTIVIDTDSLWIVQPNLHYNNSFVVRASCPTNKLESIHTAMEFVKPLIDNRGEILLTAFCVVLMYLLFRIYSHLKNIDRNLWIMSHDTYDFLEDIHGELVRLEVVVASEGTSFNELDQLEIDELIA